MMHANIGTTATMMLMLIFLPEPALRRPVTNSIDAKLVKRHVLYVHVTVMLCVHASHA